MIEHWSCPTCATINHVDRAYCWECSAPRQQLPASRWELVLALVAAAGLLTVLYLAATDTARVVLP